MDIMKPMPTEVMVRKCQVAFARFKICGSHRFAHKIFGASVA